MNTPPESMCQGRMGTLAWCLRKPTVERDGKPYCWQHDPDRIRAKARQRNQELADRHRMLEAKFDAEIERKKLLKASGIHDATDDQLRQIIALGGIAALLPGEVPFHLEN